MRTSKTVHLLNSDATKIPLPDNSVDLIITHPPYLGVDSSRYGGSEDKQLNSSQDKKKMLKLLLSATKEMYRVLKPSGSLWIANGPTDFIDVEYVSLVNKKLEFNYLGKIVQNSYDPESQERNPYKVSSEDLTSWYHFSKNESIYFNPYEVKRNSSPVWDIRFDNLNDPIDQALSINHFVLDTMNSEIPERLIKMFSKTGQTVLDPFGGSALVAVTAAKLNRVGISGDISPDMTKAAIDRALLSGVEYTVDQKF